MTISPNVVVQIYDPSRGYREWLASQIYTGPDGTGVYVPNVDDKVWDWEQGTFRVTAVDPSTYLSTLSKWVPPSTQGAVNTNDILLGSGPGTISESYRLYIDTSVQPHTLCIDSRLRAYGQDLSYAKVFRGYDAGVNGEVISSYYDQGNTLLGENIPLETVVMPDSQNVAVKTMMTGYTTAQLMDNEPCVVVFYSDSGQARSINVLLAKNTAFIRTTDASLKYITGIHLESPSLSEADDRLIEYPENTTLESLTLFGVVTYSNGETKKMPIDGNKFSLFGRDAFVASHQGQRIPLGLNYKLSSNEVNYIANSGLSKTINEPYFATTTAVNGAYTIKIFAYPLWVDAINGYRMEYFMANLDRQQIYRVTPYIEYGSDSPVFNPTLYGVSQNLTIALDLSNVNGTFPKHRHVQIIQVSLLARGDEATSQRWTVAFTPDQSPVYGQNAEAKVSFSNVNFWNMTIDAGANSKEEWLRKLFYSTQPLYNTGIEAEAPEPNFFRLVVGTWSVEQAISQWSAEFVVPSGLLNEGSLVYLEFFRRTQSTDLQLGISGLRYTQV
ncbi:MAG: hypothetical protein CL678_15910 [Bdellovibrionaceae bacterium]|nr:hypothetical protein [Pseudobdellovibrionaceae bacterium]